MVNGDGGLSVADMPFVQLGSGFMPVRDALLVLVAVGLGASGCSRAQDGTVLYANPVNRMLGTEEPAENPAPPSSSSFPPAPSSVKNSRAASGRPLRLWDVRPVRPPLAAGSAASRELSCHNAPAAGGRVVFVCD